MLAILLITLAFALLGYSLWTFSLKDELARMRKGDSNAIYIIVIMLIAFAVRAVCAVKYHGHELLLRIVGYAFQRRYRKVL